MSNALRITAAGSIVVAGVSLATLCSCTQGAGGPGEIAVYVGETATDGVLAVQLDVSGNHAACGKCDALVAIAHGGTPPYTYEWTDPTLVGPGPHTVCPTQNTRYGVIVRDASNAIPTAHAGQGVVGTALLECVPRPADAGPPSKGGLNGCLVLPQQDSVNCSDGGVAELGVTSTRIGFGVAPGETYQYTYNQLLPIGVGTPSTVDVYGGMKPCERGQKLFTLKLDSVATQTYCFTVNDAYEYSTTVVHVNGIPLTFGVTPIVCDSCPGTTSSP